MAESKLCELRGKKIGVRTIDARQFTRTVRITARTLAAECFERFPSNGHQAFARITWKG
jgi:hypothetical protein